MGAASFLGANSGRGVTLTPQERVELYISTPPVGRTACTEPQCLYSIAIPLLPLWAARPEQSLSACTRVHFTLHVWGTRWRCWLRHCATSRKVAGSDTRWCLWNFSLALVFRSHYVRLIDSAYKRNQYQECLFWGKSGRCLGMESKHFKYLEFSGPVQVLKNLSRYRPGVVRKVQGS